VIDVMVAGVIALVMLAGAFEVVSDLVNLSNQTYNNLIVRTSLLDLEGRWRGLAESERHTLLEQRSLCNEGAPALASWCENLSAQFARRQLRSRACLRERASGHLQATIVWSAAGESGQVGQCWLESEKSHHHEWQ
jgi:hypothetical protein